MMFSTKSLALLAALSSTTLAFDVYSHFYASDGTEITTTSFDVSNGGCFTVTPAATVSFTQHDTTGEADGPYCLTSYTDGGCGTVQARQQFQDVNTATDSASPNAKYTLNSGVADAPGFTWAAASCP